MRASDLAWASQSPCTSLENKTRELFVIDWIAWIDNSIRKFDHLLRKRKVFSCYTDGVLACLRSLFMKWTYHSMRLKATDWTALDTVHDGHKHLNLKTFMQKTYFESFKKYWTLWVEFCKVLASKFLGMPGWASRCLHHRASNSKHEQEASDGHLVGMLSDPKHRSPFSALILGSKNPVRWCPLDDAYRTANFWMGIRLWNRVKII